MLIEKKSCLRLFVLIIFLLPASSYCQDIPKSTFAVKERLPVAFGTIVKMNIEIVDGTDLQMKGYSDRFLLRIKSIDGVILAAPIVIEFVDESGEFPADLPSLYKLKYDKEIGSLPNIKSESAKKEYLGKAYTVFAYESGKFTGLPDRQKGYRQDTSFYFKNYIIIVNEKTVK